MAKLTIQFIGICTHFNRNTLQGTPLQGLLPVPHRVVFPQTSPVPITVLQPSGPLTFTLELQQPTLQLPDGRKKELAGQRMFIAADAQLAPPTLIPGCIPNLKTIWPDMALNLSAVLNFAPPAAAYFDIWAGDIRGFDHTSSAAAELTLDLPDARPAVLVIENFDGSAPTSILIDLNVSPSPTITIENHPIATPPITTIDSPGQEAELQLNFLVAEQFPPPVLTGIDRKLRDILECLNGTAQDIGPGCSNSQYP